MSSTLIKVLVLLIVFEIVLYEWGIFELSFFATIANVLKVAIPLVLLFIAFVVKKYPINKYQGLYITIFLVFSLLAFLACFFSENKVESFVQYFKIVPPRLLFIISISAILYNYSILIRSVSKVIFVIGALTLVQFLVSLLYLVNHPFEFSALESDRGAYFSGPFGIYGNLTTQFKFFDFNWVRLTGFWIEPSNAAGFMASSFFIGLYAYRKTLTGIRKVFLYFPIIGGFLSLSNAGYISIGLSFFILSFLRSKNLLFTAMKTIPFIIIIVIGLNGRELVAKFYPDNDYLRLIVGIRNANELITEDYTGGRIDNYTNNFNSVLDNPLGIGFRIPGEDINGKGDANASASAIFYLLKYTGFLGFICILLLKLIVVWPVISVKNRNENYDRFLFMLCAWVAISTQNIFYGTWLNPYYYFLSISVIVLFIKSRDEVIEDSF
jgi:hypothetical protein